MRLWVPLFLFLFIFEITLNAQDLEMGLYYGSDVEALRIGVKEKVDYVGFSKKYLDCLKGLQVLQGRSEKLNKMPIIKSRLVSPYGDFILFFSEREGKRGLYVYSLDTGAGKFLLIPPRVPGTNSAQIDLPPSFFRALNPGNAGKRVNDIGLGSIALKTLAVTFTQKEVSDSANPKRTRADISISVGLKKEDEKPLPLPNVETLRSGDFLLQATLQVEIRDVLREMGRMYKDQIGEKSSSEKPELFAYQYVLNMCKALGEPYASAIPKEVEAIYAEAVAAREKQKKTKPTPDISAGLKNIDPPSTDKDQPQEAREPD